MMDRLCFYVREKQHFEGRPLYEWLLEQGRSIGIHGGSAFRALAGFGRHGRLHEESFFELAGELPVKVEFVAEAELVDRLLALLQPHGLNIFYLRHAVQAGII